jgi:hypothetical protein
MHELTKVSHVYDYMTIYHDYITNQTIILVQLM